MINRFYTKTLTIKRGSYSDYISKFRTVDTCLGHIQQAGPSIIQFYEGRFNVSHLVFTDVSEDIQTGDIIEYNSINYKVQEVQKNDIGGNQHLRIMCYVGE